jgi:hypothetical protein
LEHNFGPLGTNPAASSEIIVNAISLHFTKKFTLVKYHLISKELKLKKLN